MVSITGEDNQIALDEARSRLSTLWFVGAGILFGLLFMQSVVGTYGNDLQKVWSWFIPTTAPTLSLMIGVLGAGAAEAEDSRKVRRSFYNLVRWLSGTYLVILLLTIVAAKLGKTETLAFLSNSNYWLAPIQGLVVAAMGFMFTAKSKSG